MFKTLLIANRGEIARRVIRTARRLGIRTVAVYSDADAAAAHVREADAAVRLGPAPAAESYLRVDAILQAAKETKADALHPGYGFLAENAAFAEACGKAGVTFVGPEPAAIRAMGLKDESKRLMEKAGVPVTPGYHGEDQDEAKLKAAATEIGYPVLIKAVAGGGGKGMRKVEKAGEFAAALASARREAKNAFGDDRVLVEKFVSGPRHIEVQVIGDRHGNVIHLFERDCSLQRRHQKVIEEAPAPGMTDEVRAAMTAAAVKAAEAVGYSNAGTVEFIVDGSGALRPDGFWFMEMNTRLQVEHPVTEMITGLDLVELQLRVASGDKLPKQSEITLSGHAVEARLYAEDPASGFLPSIGRLKRFDIGAPDLRVDSGVEEGDAVTPFYDPMIAKLIAHGHDRGAAIDALSGALGETMIWGVTTNAGFLKRCLDAPDFREGRFDTRFIDANGDALIAPPPALADGARTLAAALRLALGSDVAAFSGDPWEAADGFRMNAPPHLAVRLKDAAGPFERGFQRDGERWLVRAGESEIVLADLWSGGLEISATLDGRPAAFLIDEIDETLLLAADGETFAFTAPHPETAAEALEAGDDVKAPMPGKVIAVDAKAGAKVARGQTLLVLEAMKMEHALGAPRDGAISEVCVKAGAQVSQGDVLVRLENVEA